MGGTRFAAPGSPGTGPGGFILQSSGSQDLTTGATDGGNGAVMDNPQGGTVAPPGGSLPNLGYNVGGGVVPIRRTQQEKKASGHRPRQEVCGRSSYRTFRSLRSLTSSLRRNSMARFIP